jgi:hypothetical protein
MSRLATFPVDQYGRVVIPRDVIPSPLDPLVAFAQWRGKTCGPWSTAGGIGVDEYHARICRDGWIMSGEWMFGCIRCHPLLQVCHDGKTDPWVLWKQAVGATT